MKHKVAELEGALLDAAVARAEGHAEIEVSSYTKGGGVMLQRCEVVLPGEDGQEYWTEYKPSSEWERAGPIIERERIYLEPRPPGGCWNGESQAASYWLAATTARRLNEIGSTALIAAMRAYVASKHGEEIDLAESEATK